MRIDGSGRHHGTLNVGNEALGRVIVKDILFVRSARLSSVDFFRFFFIMHLTKWVSISRFIGENWTNVDIGYRVLCC